MRDFSSFRTRILSVLAAAGVTQACGGTVTDGSPSEDGPLTDAGEPPDPPVAGCPVLKVEDRILAAQSACGSGLNLCDETESVQCFAPEQLTSILRYCAAPLVEGTCPPASDVTNGDSCAATTGEPRVSSGQCCYELTRLSCAVPGRLLRVNGSICLPEVVEGASLPPRDEPGLDASARRALAVLWCEGARFEHASVAAFARITQQLLALGAPTDLVVASQRASLDEIEHARRCFALASRFAGRALRAGRLPVNEGFERITLAELAVETVIGGCVGETVAALTAAEQLGLATDPEVRAALEQIAEEEARHADLAWRIVAWAQEVGGPAVAAEIQVAFDDALRTPTAIPVGPPGAVAKESHGQLTLEEERRIRARILREVVAPCARVLAAPHPFRRAAAEQVSSASS